MLNNILRTVALLTLPGTLARDSDTQVPSGGGDELPLELGGIFCEGEKESRELNKTLHRIDLLGFDEKNAPHYDPAKLILLRRWADNDANPLHLNKITERFIGPEAGELRKAFEKALTLANTWSKDPDTGPADARDLERLALDIDEDRKRLMLETFLDDDASRGRQEGDFGTLLSWVRSFKDQHLMQHRDGRLCRAFQEGACAFRKEYADLQGEMHPENLVLVKKKKSFLGKCCRGAFLGRRRSSGGNCKVQPAASFAKEQVAAALIEVEALKVALREASAAPELPLGGLKENTCTASPTQQRAARRVPRHTARRDGGRSRAGGAVRAGAGVWRGLPRPEEFVV